MPCYHENQTKTDQKRTNVKLMFTWRSTVPQNKICPKNNGIYRLPYPTKQNKTKWLSFMVIYVYMELHSTKKTKHVQKIMVFACYRIKENKMAVIFGN